MAAKRRNLSTEVVEESSSEESGSSSNRSETRSSKPAKPDLKRKRPTTATPERPKKLQKSNGNQQALSTSSSGANTSSANEESSSGSEGRSSASESASEDESSDKGLGSAKDGGSKVPVDSKRKNPASSKKRPKDQLNDAGSRSGSETSSSSSHGKGSKTKQDKHAAKTSLSNGRTDRTQSPAPASSAPSADLETSTSSTTTRYAPPVGFNKIPANSTKTNTLEALLDTTGLGEKEIWYITAPASLPLHSIKFAERDKPKQDRISVTHEGVDYELLPEDGARPYLMSAEAGGATYKAGTLTPVTIPRNLADMPATVETDFTNIVALRRTVKKPMDVQSNANNQAGSQAAGVATVPVVKQTPKQPSGLSQKYWATGFEEGIRPADRQSTPKQRQVDLSKTPNASKLTNGVAPNAASKSEKEAATPSKKTDKRKKSPSPSESGSDDSSDEEPAPIEQKMKLKSVKGAQAIVKKGKPTKPAKAASSSDGSSAGSGSGSEESGSDSAGSGSSSNDGSDSGSAESESDSDESEDDD